MASGGEADEPLANPTRRTAALVLLSVTLVWGATFIWMKQALNALDGELQEYGTIPVVAFLVGARFFIAMVLILTFFSEARASLKNRELWKGGGVLGGLMLVGFVTQMVALEDINPSTSAFLTSLYVVMTALLSVRMTQHPPRATLYWGVFLATFGAGFIEGPPHLSWGWGEIVTVISAFFFALHIIFTQNLTQKLDPIGLSLTSFTAVSIGALLIMVFSSREALEMIPAVLSTKGVLLPLFLLGLGGSFFCLIALNMYQRHMHPVQAAIIYAFEPVWATVFGLSLGLVPWTWWILIGGGVLLGGNLLVELTTPKDETAEENA
jgi:drug/metabolite transporter (DMT)-like permease